jgi:molybdenum cofactor cytidylyltransferase
MIAGLILAAGGSSRMGRPKQLLPFRGRPLLRRAIDAALEGGCRPVMVVVGEHAGPIQSELGSLPVEFCVNEEWRQGLAGSIRCGMEALRSRGERLQAVLMLTCDQALLSADVVARLCDAFDGERGRMVACEYAGTVGVPALFERSCFDRLMGLAGDRGAKSVLLGDSTMVLRLPWPQGACDINTPADFEKFE